MIIDDRQSFYTYTKLAKYNQTFYIDYIFFNRVDNMSTFVFHISIFYLNDNNYTFC